MEQPHNNNDDEIPEFGGAVQNLVNAAMATAAAFKARSGYREAVQALIAAALALAIAGFLPGLRFHPKDEELIGFFLRKKVKAEAFPVADMMRETNVMLHNPMSLAAMLPKLGDREWYFFTPRFRKYRHGERPDRGTDGGFWKATGADKAVSLDGETVGFKKSLVFYLNKKSEGELDRKTKWIMYEFRLNQPPRIQEHEDDMRLDDWVLCSIHEQPQTKRAVKRKQPMDQAVDDAEMDHVDVNVNTSVDPDDNRVVEQENSANLEQQPNVDQADQHYRYQHDQYQYQYMEQQPPLQQPLTSTVDVVEQEPPLQQPLPSVDVVEQEQYAYEQPLSRLVVGQEQNAYHLPTLYHVPVIDQQGPSSSSRTLYHVPVIDQQALSSSSRIYEQYQYLPVIDQQALSSSSRIYEQYQYLEQQPSTSTSASSNQQDQMEQLPSLHVTDNSLDPSLSFEWLDFLNFNIQDQAVGTSMSSYQDQGTTNNSNHALVDIANANIMDNNYASRS